LHGAGIARLRYFTSFNPLLALPIYYRKKEDG